MSLATALDADRPVEQAPDSGAWMRVPICNASGWKVDAITTEEPLFVRVHRDGRRQFLARRGLLLELPDQRASGDGGRAKRRCVAVDVVDRDVAVAGLDTFRVLVERQDQ